MSREAFQLAIFVGLQASGKTSFCRERFAATHVHVSKDLMRRGNKAARQEAQVIAALGEGRSVVVDNTNPSVAERAALIEIGHRFGAEVIGYYFASTLQSSLERNRQRAGKARVPDVALYATRARLQLPSYAEGFDRLFTVRIAVRGGFVVRARRRDDDASSNRTV